MGLSYEGAKIAAKGLRDAIKLENHEFIIEFLALLKNNGEVSDIVWAEFKRLGAEALTVIRKNGNSHQVANCLNNLGKLYLEKDPVKALDYLFELVPIYKEEENFQLLLNVWRSIAVAFNNLQLHQDAAKALEIALRILTQYEIKNVWQRLTILLELSTTYWLAGDLEQSIKTIEEIEAAFDGSQPEIMSWAISYRLAEHKGNLSMSQKEYQQAEVAYKKAFSLLEASFYMAAATDIRLSIQSAIHKLSQHLLNACLKQRSSANDKRLLHRAITYAELSRSRLFLTDSVICTTNLLS